MMILLALITGVSATDPIVMYSGPGASLGNELGSRATTTAICASEASSIGLECNATFMFIAYAGDTMFTPCVPGATSQCFSANVSVVRRSGLVIASDWGELFSDARIMNGFYPSDTYWTGMTSAGEVADNCDDWSAATLGAVGSGSASTGGNWIHSDTVLCSMQVQDQYCVCVPHTTVVQTTPSSSPSSKAPTTSPPQKSTGIWNVPIWWLGMLGILVW